MKNFSLLVHLLDEHRNTFQVNVSKRTSECYLTKGWNEMGKFYGLRSGEAITMTVVRFDKIFIAITNRVSGSPFLMVSPKILRLNQEPTILEEDVNDINYCDQSMYIGREPWVVVSLHIKLLKSDITTSYLVC